ncbi:MAG: trypsin-like serine protease [Gammaproteobacteria bacterium]|nr:trypsin-like serine protease [Gammaproteobacteria bacterium]
MAQETVTSPVQQAISTQTYWTSDRKGAAQPMPLRTMSGSPSAALAGILQSSGQSGSVNGNAPGKKAIVADQQSIVAPAFGAGSTVWYSYPPPSTLYVPILDYVVAPLYPNTAVGKLYFNIGASRYVCSAQSVTSAGDWGVGNRQTVVTAGHCCSDSSGFFSNWLFEPAHFNGAAPLGSWTASTATVLNSWYQNEDMSRDVCVLQMNTLNGKNINDAVGALGYAYNQPLPQHYHATGWPAAAPFNGGMLYISTASDAETDTNAAGDFPYTHGIGNLMTGGSSGGAWIRQFQPLVGVNQFNGLNSYKYIVPNRPAEMFGPYIDDVIIFNLLQVVATSPAAP